MATLSWMKNAIASLAASAVMKPRTCSAATRCRRTRRAAADHGAAQRRPVRSLDVVRIQPGWRRAAALDVAAQGEPRGARASASRVHEMGLGRRSQAEGLVAATGGGIATLYFRLHLGC